MDDLGAEHLSQLSSSASPCSKTPNACAILGASSPSNVHTNVASVADRCAKFPSPRIAEGSERDENRLATDIRGATSVASRNVARSEDSECGRNQNSVNVANTPVDEDSEGKEKSDITPENLKKIVDDVISSHSGTCKSELETTTPGSKSASDGISSPTTSGDHVTADSTSIDLQIVEDESPTKQALAFTIDFSDGMEKNAGAAAATSQKYSRMVERFQNRHRRGASMSKIEDQTVMPSTPISGRASRVSSAQSGRAKPSETSESIKVKMRIRDRSTSGVRDANKRHSWSPRSSTHEPIDGPKSREVKQAEPVRPSRRTMTSTTMTSSIAPQTTNKNESVTKFTPRSTAMQLALNKVEFVCPHPPLDDFRAHKKLEDDESVSEAGTYTVDGDNYTEEQKDLMNIDKSAKRAELRHLRNQQERELTDTGQNRPTDLPLQLSSSIESRRRNNVLEISYYHDSTNVKPKISYLEKIKSRVKGIAKSPDKQERPSSDRGTFTSVTTSGVLSKKPTLDARPKIHRKNSLTKSHIDSSEYVSSETNSKSSIVGNNVVPKYPNTAFTDHQKAEYKLNVFAKHSGPQILNEMYPCEVTPLHTPESPADVPVMAETTVLKTAQTKNDWIQEWARNARARSATVKSNNSEQMSRSFNFENTEDSMLSDPISYHSKRIDRYRHNGMSDLEYASDTNLSNQKLPTAYDYQNFGGGGGGPNVTARPPLSPSKIPSPVHTVGRTRVSNRVRGSLQDLSPNAYTPETDVYLQKTAVAISNLAQSLSRKNSLQSSPSSKNNSPRRDIYQPSYQSQHYSADEYSPSHNNHQQQGMHKRHLSHGDYRTNLMSHSLNSEQLSGMLVDYRTKQQPRDRQRQNSFDASMNSPRRMHHSQNFMSSNNQRPSNLIEQTISSIKQHQPHQQSPIRRSSSFSSKAQPLGSSKMTNQNFANKGNHSRPPLTNRAPIQKSASSTSFRKMYSDYDDNIEYYINDEDDLVDDFCSSDEFDEPNEYYANEMPAIEQPEPLTNTRYNKALLMRIEKSKQKVASNNATPLSAQNKQLMGGAMACPNTPEMPRRSAQNVIRASLRQSVPRDSSLNRLRGEVPSSLASAKKQLLQSATAQNASGKKVQPKYMDISKYKTNQTGNFLRRDESKITLAPTPKSNEIKRSPSSASVVLNRNDPVRASNRSVKSAGGKPNNNNVAKQKENELAMWRRRATYDPMKAAAEGRRKQEEAKKANQGQQKLNDSSIVARSQSFHSGIGQHAAYRNANNSKNEHHQEMPSGAISSAPSATIKNSCVGINVMEESLENDEFEYETEANQKDPWTLKSNESSDECDENVDNFNRQ